MIDIKHRMHEDQIMPNTCKDKINDMCDVCELRSSECAKKTLGENANMHVMRRMKCAQMLAMVKTSYRQESEKVQSVCLCSEHFISRCF